MVPNIEPKGLVPKKTLYLEMKSTCNIFLLRTSLCASQGRGLQNKWSTIEINIDGEKKHYLQNHPKNLIIKKHSYIINVIK